nr:immunoglobulin heavy chain junction region [Macaca mulatta]MOW86492.1 immunoglobulin heavy chain junction region [Macaca mulatta]MOW86514.1 immunoglobulin heavy chain junction region [Macaca mulatta]MOW86568.1 immunoglobulin heavy chain junction region [Macaca mulatta]MOW86579.1 immunoglobulin heavy chain junction region [Macaca mulatta]
CAREVGYSNYDYW